MGRPGLDLGTYGKITCTGTAPRVRARCKYRDYDGIVRDVERYGTSNADATRKLKTALEARISVAGRGRITGDMWFRDLTPLWLDTIDESAHLAVGTKQHYRKVAGYVDKALGSFRLRECSVGTVDLALKAINAERGPSVAKSSKAVLSGALGLAVRHGAIPANPVRDTQRLTVARKKQPRALTADEETYLTDRLRTVPRAVEVLDMADLVDWMLATGCRIGEALALRHGYNPDGQPLIDFAAGTWEINATVIRVKGRGLVIQERPKSAAGHRIIAVPEFAMHMLEQRRHQLRLTPETVKYLNPDTNVITEKPVDLVFASPSAKALRDPSNCAGDLREVLALVDPDNPDRFAWVTSHTFRKTVITKLFDAGQTELQVADHAGHEKPSMTQDVYGGRKVANAEAAGLLARRG